MKKNKYENCYLKYRNWETIRTQKTLVELYCNNIPISGFHSFSYIQVTGYMFSKYNKMAKGPKALNIQYSKMFKMLES